MHASLADVKGPDLPGLGRAEPHRQRRVWRPSARQRPPCDVGTFRVVHKWDLHMTTDRKLADPSPEAFLSKYLL